MAQFKRRHQKRKRPEPPGPSGFVVVDKPPGRTSHDVVDAARHWFGTRRVGHLGTLDPQATGVLPLAIRGATKLIPFMDGAIKGYDGTVVLGSETDTLDREGVVVRQFSGPLPDRTKVEATLSDFIGDIQQVPPMYSAVKKNGVALHMLARRGEEIERDPKWVTIEALELLRFESPEFDLRVRCSTGTYVRVIAADLGKTLGCGAHLRALRRTRSGPFSLAVAHRCEAFEAAVAAREVDSLLISMADALGFPVHRVAGEQQLRIQNGGDLPSGDLPRMPPGARVSILDAAGNFLAVAEVRADRRIWPLRVLPAELS